jgi:hypothetical protein
LFAGSPVVCLVKKLNQTKAALKRWNIIHFGNIQEKIKASLLKIEEIQLSPPSPQASVLVSLLRKEHDDLLIKKESLWRTKSNDTELKCKELNTKFFHSSTMIMRRSNAVNFLKTSKGAWVPPLSPPSPQASVLVSLLRKEHDDLLIKEESLWRTKSRDT